MRCWWSSGNPHFTFASPQRNVGGLGTLPFSTFPHCNEGCPLNDSHFTKQTSMQWDLSSDNPQITNPNAMKVVFQITLISQTPNAMVVVLRITPISKTLFNAILVGFAQPLQSRAGGRHGDMSYVIAVRCLSKSSLLMVSSHHVVHFTSIQVRCAATPGQRSRDLDPHDIRARLNVLPQCSETFQSTFKVSSDHLMGR
jgi:hypothetical protein